MYKSGTDQLSHLPTDGYTYLDTLSEKLRLENAMKESMDRYNAIREEALRMLRVFAKEDEDRKEQLMEKEKVALDSLKRIKEDGMGKKIVEEEVDDDWEKIESEEEIVIVEDEGMVVLSMVGREK